MEYKIISLYQLNKLKEYRLMYGDLLSVHELAFIESWDFQTYRKVMPLVTVKIPENDRIFSSFRPRSLRHDLIIKTCFDTFKSKGYTEPASDENDGNEFTYSGTPVRLSLRYDLDYRDKVSLGIRMEKDPGEPFLVSSDINSIKLKTPDLFTGYLQLKNMGLFHSIILGNYRVNFGYGISIAGGQPRMTGRNGLAGLAGRIRPQTSTGESGFFRGAAISTIFGKFTLTCFGSSQNLDGNSVVVDSATGSTVSFSSINTSGLHRTENEMENRNAICEQVLGGFALFQNNWMKTGMITIYNRFSAPVESNSRPYAIFGFSGKENLVTGISTTIWLRKLQFFNESSMSRNKGLAFLAGAQLAPVPGVTTSLVYRYFDVRYQNLYGAGYLSQSRNSNESGLRASMRVELPKKWMVELMTDLSKTTWASYDLAAPSTNWQAHLQVEKSWDRSQLLTISIKYLNQAKEDREISGYLVRPVSLSHYKMRVEGRVRPSGPFSLKSRIECSFITGLPVAWLLMEDIECSPGWNDIKLWLRCCFFDVPSYESRIYAYENDVLYDFSTMMHYGKGLRGVIMTKLSLVKWLDVWVRFSTIYYTNKNVGSGWDEINGSRQNEVEIQLRIRVPG
jgi:hypothetical protein